MTLKRILYAAAKRFTSPYDTYIISLSKPLISNICLFEAGQGKNINGNMFSLLRCLTTIREFNSYRAIYVVTEDTIDSAKQRFADYGLTEIEFVIRDSDEYQEYLARAQYLFTDNSFPTYFCKRQDQTYLNTWHGTPLKHLGYSDIKNSIFSMANVQKNFLDADYVLFPNELTKRVFWQDYRLSTLFSNRYIMADYPRNDVLTDDETRKKIRLALSLEDKQVISYMPTWRGTKRSADVANQKRTALSHLEQFDKELSDDQILYVNLHFLITGGLDFSSFKHIKPFPSNFETYDFLSACDMLITDYSSVFFDFAVTGRPIFLFAYDEEKYLREKGVYIPLENLPFPVSRTPQELFAHINSHPHEMYPQFMKEYCSYHSGHTTQDILTQVFTGQSTLDVRRNSEQQVHAAIFVSTLNRKLINELLYTYLKGKSIAKNLLLVFGGKPTDEASSFLASIPQQIPCLALPASKPLTTPEKTALLLVEHFPFLAKTPIGRTLETALRREAHRLYHNLNFSEFTIFNADGSYGSSVASMLDCNKSVLLREDSIMGVNGKKKISMLLRNDVEPVAEHSPLSSLSNEAKLDYYSRSIDCSLLTRRGKEKNESLILKGKALLQTSSDIDPTLIRFTTEALGEIGGLTSGKKGKCRQVVSYQISIPKKAVCELPIHNYIMTSYSDSTGMSGKAAVRFSSFDRRRGKNKIGALFIAQSTNTTSYFRQAAKNKLCFSTRDTISIDLRSRRAKMRLAHALSKLPSSKKRAIVLYEKNASRYEESASVLYEELLRRGVSNAFFILNKEYVHAKDIPEQYKSHIVDKDSLKHYLLFFSAKTFIGTEMLAHAVGVRPANRLVSKRLNDKNINYVFLQHGVMYMLSLDSSARTFFRPKKLNGKYRVVVSSDLEKAHFVERGGYEPRMLYVCGLPKFDRNTWAEGNAQTIAIMPTWRPWEYNVARIDFTDTSYYHFLEKTFDSIPQEYRDKVVILPHPLFLEAAEHAEFPLKKYLVDAETSYGSILRRTKVLITDYSSIAYDAFYRGANVIFYWEDLQYCMDSYGENSELMINEQTAFGDICWNTDDLNTCFAHNYTTPQNAEYKRRYSQIVKFHDGHNTDRLISLLTKDKLLS